MLCRLCRNHIEVIYKPIPQEPNKKPTGTGAIAAGTEAMATIQSIRHRARHPSIWSKVGIRWQIHRAWRVFRLT